MFPFFWSLLLSPGVSCMPAPAELGVVLYAGNGSSAAVRVAAALHAQYFPPHAGVRHYLCTDVRAAAARDDLFENMTVLAFPDVVQDAKFLYCVRRVSERSVLLIMDDWWLQASVDTNVLVAAAQRVGATAASSVSALRLACWDHEQLAFGGVSTPWPGVYLQFDLPLQPTIWRRDTLAEILERTIAWVPAHSKHCNQRQTCPHEDARPVEGFRIGRQRVKTGVCGRLDPQVRERNARRSRASLGQRIHGASFGTRAPTTLLIAMTSAPPWYSPARLTAGPSVNRLRTLRGSNGFTRFNMGSSWERE